MTIDRENNLLIFSKAEFQDYALEFFNIIDCFRETSDTLEACLGFKMAGKEIIFSLRSFNLDEIGAVLKYLEYVRSDGKKK